MSDRVILYSYLTNYYKITMLKNTYRFSKRLKALIPDTLDLNRPYLFVSDNFHKPIKQNEFISDYLDALDNPSLKNYITNTPQFLTILERYKTNTTFKGRTIESKRKTLVKWLAKSYLLFKLIKITPFNYLQYLSNRSLFNLKPDIMGEIMGEVFGNGDYYNQVFLCGDGASKAKLYLAESFLSFKPEDNLEVINIRKENEKTEHCHILDLSHNGNYKEINFEQGIEKNNMNSSIKNHSCFIMFFFGKNEDIELFKDLIDTKEIVNERKIIVLLQNILVIKDLWPILKNTKYRISQMQSRNYKVNNNVFSTTFSDNPNECIMLTINK